jgi:hypothetical protein
MTPTVAAKYRLILAVGTVLFIGTASFAQVNLNAPVEEKPTIASEIQRGIDAGFQ